MAKKTDGIPNPKRVAAGRRNQRKWKGLTEAGRLRQRESVLQRKPWLRSTGPRTAEGKAKSALNGKKQQQGELSVREMRRELSEVGTTLDCLATIRQQVLDAIQ